MVLLLLLLLLTQTAGARVVVVVVVWSQRMMMIIRRMTKIPSQRMGHRSPASSQVSSRDGDGGDDGGDYSEKRISTFLAKMRHDTYYHLMDQPVSVSVRVRVTINKPTRQNVCMQQQQQQQQNNNRWWIAGGEIKVASAWGGRSSGGETPTHQPTNGASSLVAMAQGNQPTHQRLLPFYPRQLRGAAARYRSTGRPPGWPSYGLVTYLAPFWHSPSVGLVPRRSFLPS